MSMTVTEAAKRLSLTPQGVRNAIATGSLSATRSAGASPLMRVPFLLEEDEVERYRRERGGGKGRSGRLDAKVVAEMKGRGYLTATEAATEIGVDRTYLVRLIREGKVEAHREGGYFLTAGTVARLKREREAKIAAVAR